MGQHANDGWLAFGIYPDGATETQLNSGQAVLSNAQWTHIVVSYDGTQQRMYIDGQPLTSNTVGQELLNRIGELRTGNVLIAGPEFFFDGQIDDVRVYNYPLDATAIAALFQGGRADNPCPIQQAQDVPLNQPLCWTEGVAATAHDVYFGMDETAVSNATRISGEYVDRITQDSICQLLSLGIHYYWRVDEVLSGGSVVPGEVWSFTAGTYMTTDDLTFHLPLDETSGTTAGDISGNNNHGSLTGDVDFAADSATGKIDLALGFDGIDDEIILGDMPVTGQAGFTVSAWINPDSITTDWSGIISKWGADIGNHTFWLGQHGNDGWLRFCIYIDGSTETSLDSGQPVLSNGRWTHVAVSYDGVEQKMYIGGQLLASVAVSGPLMNRNGVLRIGNVPVGAPQFFFDGQIDDVGLWDRALIDGEIEAIYEMAEKSISLISYDENIPAEFIASPLHKPDAVEGTAYSGQSLSADVFDPDLDETSIFSKVSGPDWLDVLANGDLSGTPDDSDVGVNSFDVQVSDGGFSDTATLNITVRNVFDGKWGLSDFVDFSAQWNRVDCGYCGGADLDGDQDVDLNDLRCFAGNWLTDDI